MDVSDIPRRPRSGRQIVRVVIGALIVVAIGWYLIAHRRDLVHLQGIPPLLLLLLVVARAAAIAALQWTSLILLRVFAPAIGFSEYLLLVAGGAVADYFIPFGGLSGKALYLHRRHGVSPGQLVSAMAYQGIVRFLLCGLLSAVFLATMMALLHDGLGRQVGPLHWLAVSLALLGGLVPLLLLSPLGRVARKLRLFSRLADGWDTLAGSRGIVLPATAAAFTAMLTHAAVFGFLWSTMIPTSQFMIGALASLLVLPLKVVRLTPGNLGTQEGAIGLLGYPFGVPVSVGAVVSIVSRLLGIAALLLLAGLSAASQRFSRQARDA